MAAGPTYSGKVRDVYDVDDKHLLMVSSDRVSAFDVILPNLIPDRGRVLTALTHFWITNVFNDMPNHLVSVTLEDAQSAVPGLGDDEDLAGRTMLVRKAKMTPIEWIVRGYLAGTAWREYQRSGTVHNIPMPDGLQLGSQFSEPLLTPSTKGAQGSHDENLSVEQTVALVGADVVDAAGRLAIDTYRRANDVARENGFVVADTKLELGWIDGELSLCDEVVTPDSSRYWPAGGWTPGAEPPAYDKELVRTWLSQSGWDKQPPAPTLPDEIVARTRERYVDVYERICGCSFSDWPGVTTGH